jgi:hypothetical protein
LLLVYYFINMLETIITSKTRLRILVKFFINVANNGYLRGLAEEMQESTNSIRKELNNLSEAGYLEKEIIQNRVSYRANVNHPLFNTLQKIIHQHIGLDSIVELIVSRMGSVNKIIIVGDYANGIDSGVIEVILIGNQIKMDYVKRLSYKIEKEIKRKIQFTSLDSYHGSGLVLYQV